MFNMSKLATAVRSAAVLGTVSTMVLSGAALAQSSNEEESAEGIEKVSVTGSRIKRKEITSISPTIELSDFEFDIAGSFNIEQRLAQLPSTLPAFGPSSNNPGDGTATVNLRGVGTARTLVLVNGRRWVPSRQDGVVDLNTIPVNLIKNVEIITGGSSAVYGSDALGGVVNFDLVDDFEGVEFNAQYQTTGDNDGERYNFDITMGGNFADDKGNAVLFLGYADRRPIFQADRDFTNVALQEGDTDGDGFNDSLVPGGSAGVPGTRVFGPPALDGGGTCGIFEPDGNCRTWLEPGDRFNYAPDNFLQLPQERYTIQAFAHYELAEDVRLYGEMSYIRNVVPQELAPTPAFVGSLEVNPDSAFFGPTAQQAFGDARTDTNGDGVIDSNDNFIVPFVGRRMVENGSRQSIDSRNAFRMLVGIDGAINDDWTYDVYFSKSILDGSNTLENDVSESRFRQAILVTDDATACQDPSGGCAPLNIWGAGNISQEAIDFIKVGATNLTTIEQDVFSASVSGILPITVPSADEEVGLVIGVERRVDDSRFRPDTFLSAGDVLGFNAGDATVGSYSSNEVFAEVSVPLVQDKEFVEDLSLWGAFRYSDYSNIGGVDSFAGALSYSPTETVGLRVSFQRAVRAPNVSELFLGQSNGFPGATDPCSVAGFIEGTTDRALCEATGVAANQVGVFTQANGQIEGLFGGNPDLTEETSDTFSVGLSVEPIENLSITVDYFDITIEDAISVLGGGVNNVLDICYNQIQDANSPFCQAISRRADGNVDLVNVLNENIAEIATTGVDLNVFYTHELDFGLFDNSSQFTADFRSTYLDSFDTTPVVGLETVNECAGSFGNTCGIPRSEFQYNFRLTWSSGPLTVSTLIRYMSAVDDDELSLLTVDPSLTGNTASGPRVVSQERFDEIAANNVVPEIDDAYYVDLSAAYEVNDNMSVNFGIINLFEEDPTAVPDPQQQQANTFPEVYDVIGRQFFINANYTF